MQTTSIEVIPATPGTPFEGGFFVSGIRVGDNTFAIVVAPRAEGDHDDIVWSESEASVAGALSFNDGFANTEAMAAAGSDLAKWARGLRIGDHDDWYLPSRDELELIYRHLKPTGQENDVWRHGDNPSSVIPGYPYTETSPAQTTCEAFRAGGAEALSDELYWASTGFAGYESSAWSQYFSDGYQNLTHKDLELRARAVRRLLVK